MPHIFIPKTTPPYIAVGSLVDVLEIIFYKLGHCTKLVMADGGLFGTKLPDNTWSGLIGQLIREEVDMSAAPLSMSEPRAKAIDFSVPLYMDIQTLAYKRPVYESDLAGFIKAYQNQIWVLLFVTLLMTFFAIYTINYISSSQRYANLKDKAWLASQLTIMPLLAQSISWRHIWDGKRAITGIWLLTSFVIGSVYRGNLKAMLILPKLQLPFDNLQELLESKIETFVPKGSALKQTIDESSSDTGLHQLKRQLSLETNTTKVTDLVIKGHLAAFTSEHLMLFIMHDTYGKTKTCPLYFAKQKFFEATSIGFGFPKGSPLRAKINPIIDSLREFGILNHLFKRKIKNAYLCLQNEALGKNGLRPLDVGDFYGVFSVYLGGILTATIAFILEIIMKIKNHDE